VPDIKINVYLGSGFLNYLIRKVFVKSCYVKTTLRTRPCFKFSSSRLNLPLRKDSCGLKMSYLVEDFSRWKMGIWGGKLVG
jgi:hypothetical protein